MPPGLTISRPTADSDIRVDTPGAESFGEVGGANADPLKEYCVVPFPCVPKLQVQGHLPTSKTCMRNPEDGTPCDRERFLNRTSFLISL